MTAWLDTLNPLWLHLATFLILFLEGAGIPGIPGFLPMLALAESIHAGQTTLFQAIWWGALGNWLGSLAGYRAAHSALKRLPPSWQRAARSARIARLMARWGGALVVVSRTVGSLRTPVTLYAGASDYRWRAYLLYSALGAALHVGVWQTLLWRFGPDILGVVGRYEQVALPYIVGLVALLVALFGLRAWKRRDAHYTDARHTAAYHTDTQQPGRDEQPGGRQISK